MGVHVDAICPKCREKFGASWQAGDPVTCYHCKYTYYLADRDSVAIENFREKLGMIDAHKKELAAERAKTLRLARFVRHILGCKTEHLYFSEIQDIAVQHGLLEIHASQGHEIVTMEESELFRKIKEDAQP